jgi:hypothetical protein
MWSLTLPLAKRMSGPKKLLLVTLKRLFQQYRREAAIPSIGCVRCGTCYEIEMISSF